MIDKLAAKVESGPPMIFGNERDYYRECWALIKEIGPAFKETRYPTRGDKDKAWSQFQAAVADVKERQSRFEGERTRNSERIRDALLRAADMASPSKYGIVEALFDAMERAVGDVVDATITAITLGFIKPDPADPKQWLLDLNENLRRAWAKFKELQHELRREHHQEVFDRLQEVREELDEAWGSWKAKNQEQYEARQKRREEWREKQTSFLEKLRQRLSNQENYLEKKKQELSSLEEKRDDARSDEFRERVEGWIEQCEGKIREVEADIKQLEDKINEVESGLSR